jgi:hypothetical protein
MTKTQIIIVSVIVGLAILFLFSIETNQTSPQVKVQFVGFTNNPYGKTEIRFSFTNCTKYMTWNVDKMNKEAGNGWESVEPPSDYITYATDPLPSSFEVGIPIPQTNVTWRLIFRFNEKATGLSGLIDSSKEIFSKLSGTPEELYMGRVYFVTNEISNIR